MVDAGEISIFCYYIFQNRPLSLSLTLRGWNWPGQVMKKIFCTCVKRNFMKDIEMWNVSHSILSVVITHLAVCRFLQSRLTVHCTYPVARMITTLVLSAFNLISGVSHKNSITLWMTPRSRLIHYWVPIVGENLLSLAILYHLAIPIWLPT